MGTRFAHGKTWSTIGSRPIGDSCWGGQAMITKFDSLFAGHVDIENVGYGGVAVNDRRYPNEHLATVFDKAEAMAKLMDRLGYHAFWMAEHHFQHEGYECIPNVLMAALHLAHLTRNIKLGCGFNITPMWHPLRLAEDFATADILTGGRTIFGVGRGYHTREVETFDAPMLNQEANRDLFEEQVEIIFKAFNEESFSHRGKHYTLPPRVPYRGYELEQLTLVPRPIHRPVECWQPIVSANPRGLASWSVTASRVRSAAVRRQCKPDRLPLTVMPWPGRVSTWRSARTSRSDCIFISPKLVSRRSARSPRSTRSTSRC